MSHSIHNLDQHMTSLRKIIAGGKKRIGFLLGAGASAGMKNQDGKYPLIPTVDGLTCQVLTSLESEYGSQLQKLKEDIKPAKDIETLLSRVRTLSNVLGSSTVHGLDGDGWKNLSERICKEIGQIVAVSLPESRSAYLDLVTWISGAWREYPIEIFTTNYDLLLEEAFDRLRAPYFDGFIGGCQPFFDPVTVASNDLPARWTRLWKLHGSLGWCSHEKHGVIRVGRREDASELVFPEHLKYEQTQKAPYSALLDRLRSFLSTPDTLLIAIGFSFADAHISARIDEGLSANPHASVFAFQYRNIEAEAHAAELASRLSNFTIYARNEAIVNCVKGSWHLPSTLPSEDWGPIRNLYWDDNKREFKLGAIEDFSGFFATSRAFRLIHNQNESPLITET